MSNLNPEDFERFFGELYQDENGKPLTPFPWQSMLVKRVAEQGWPEGIDLPTASGKTACIDVAVFLMAMGVHNETLPLDHPARRRIFFVVDRRIVVDEAYQRAVNLADKLNKAEEGIVKRVADQLRKLAGKESKLAGKESPVPLVVSRLRGGTVKDEQWQMSPTQPAVITSTVDQIGSRMLFRSYDTGPLSAPIEAALTACDSLVFLDEAHCAVPFMQTARAVARYAGKDWMETEPIVSPLKFCILSATLPKDVRVKFPEDTNERNKALDHPILQQRIKAQKTAKLIEVKDSKDDDTKLIDEAVSQAKRMVDDGYNRIAVMVNRVARAAKIEGKLQEQVTSGELKANVVLMTGRMRPLDRDELVNKWTPILKAGSKQNPDRPIILVTTQCLEVGADFSFDALITECASLDALRQRFGRLNRLGEFKDVDAAVLVRKGDLGAKSVDSIYGDALKNTWEWLDKNAKQQSKDKFFDFGIQAVEDTLSDDKSEGDERLNELNAPSSNAPVMLPAHVDLLCQTAPRPTPDPDVAMFLHGPQRGAPEARVVFRADLIDDYQDKWPEIVALLPPLTAEALNLPLSVLRNWLADSKQEQEAEFSDVEGLQSDEDDERTTRGQPFVIWRGRRKSTVSHNPQDVRPYDTIVVPANEMANLLGHAFCRPEDGLLDVAEQAYPQGRNQHILRVSEPVLKKWKHIPPVDDLLKWANNDDRESSELSELLQAITTYKAEEEGEINDPLLPEWLKGVVENLKTRPRIERHPISGVVLFGPLPKKKTLNLIFHDFSDEDDDWSSSEGEVNLEDHTDHVHYFVKEWAKRSLPASLIRSVNSAAKLHDLGKADPRFQEMLHGDEIQAAIAMSNGRYIAKSQGPRRSPSVQRQIRQAAELPEDFRHEMLSMQMVEESSQLSEDTIIRKLILHLIASHHGHGRPFAPVCIDKNPPDVKVNGYKISEQQRNELPPHRLDSGVAERFWQLTRCYGWWGVAYLEAILRLADRAASSKEAAESTQQKKEVRK